MLGKPRHDPAGEQLVLGGRVDDHVAVARPDHRDVVDAARDVREEVGDLDAALAVLLERPARAQQLGVALDQLVLGLAELLGPPLPFELVQERLGIERLQVAGPAGHEQEDDRARLGREMGRLGSERPRPIPREAARHASSEASARPPKPAKASGRTPGACGSGGCAGDGRAGISPDIEEPVEVEDGQGEILQRLVAEERKRRVAFRVRGRPAQGQPERAIDERPRVAPDSFSNPAGERPSQVVRQAAVEQLEGLGSVRARLAPGATRLQGRRVERLHERQSQVALGDQVDRAPVVLGLRAV